MYFGILFAHVFWNNLRSCNQMVKAHEQIDLGRSVCSCLHVPHMCTLIFSVVFIAAHRKVHDLENTITCSDCGVVLKDDKALKRHYSREHKQS